MVKLQDMSRKELQDHLKKRYKDQNNKIKEKYDRVSATLPDGTKERIKNLGLSINGYINELVLKDLEQREKQAEKEDLKEKCDAIIEEYEKTEALKTNAHYYLHAPKGSSISIDEIIKEDLLQIAKDIDDELIAAGLPELDPAKKAEIKANLDKQIAEYEAKKAEKQKQEPRKDNFSDTLERYRKENSEGKLALNVREVENE